MRKRMLVTTSVLALTMLVAAACGSSPQAGGGDDGNSKTPAATKKATEKAPAPNEAAATVALASSEYGTILVDPDGKSLYMFDPDKQGDSTCYQDCAKAWPPLTAKDEPLAGKGIDQSLLGTVTRKDGSKQVTYNGWPLYYWVKDSSAGDVTGQGVNKVWWVMTADGKPVRKSDEAAEAPDKSKATLTLAKSEYGTILVDPDGKSLYMFDPDKQGDSTCYDQCATLWPPLTVKDKPVAGKGIDQSLLGTVTRKDGSKEVTYNGWPLYYWASDTKAGDVKGQGVNDVWWVMTSDGKPIRKAD